MSQQNANKATHQGVFHIPIIWEDDPSPLPELPATVDIALQASADALIKCVQSMVQEGMASYEEYQAGKIDRNQFTYRMIHKGSEAAVSTGVRTGAALALTETARRYIVRRWGTELLKRLGRYNLISAMAFGLVDQTKHTFKLYQGSIDNRQYKVHTAENVGGTGGAISGAAVGSMLGSIVPGLGTGAGALVGAMLGMMGAAAGATMGKSLGEDWFPDQDANKDDGEGGGGIDIPIE